MNLACSTLSFNGLSLNSALEKIAFLGFKLVDAAVFDNPEWSHVNHADVARDSEAAGASLKAAASKFGLGIAAFNAALKVAPERKSLETSVARAARSAGAAVVTFSGDNEKPDAQSERFMHLVSVGGNLGVQVAVENHVGTSGETPEGAARLLDTVPGLGLTFDPSHVLMQGQRLSEWQFLFPRVRQVHFRDAERGSMQVRMGSGDLDAREMIEMLLQAGYSGVISVEYLKPSQIGAGEYDVAEDIRAAQDILLEALKEY